MRRQVGGDPLADTFLLLSVLPSARFTDSAGSLAGGGEWGSDVAKPATAEAAIAAFCRYQRKRNLSENTIGSRRRKLTALARGLPVDLLNATTPQIERWLDRQNQPGGLAPQTRSTYIAQFAAFYGWAMKQRIVKEDPTEELIRPKLPEYVPRPWNPEDVARAIVLADDRMRCFLLLCWFAGARCMEIAALRVEEIHGDSLLLHGKGNKERVVPLHPEVKRALNSYGLPRAGYIFRRRDGWPLKPGTVSKYISRYLHSLDVNATAHMGRHRYATDLYELSDGDLLMVADLLGHATTAPTKRYAQWARTRATDTVGQLCLPAV